VLWAGGLEEYRRDTVGCGGEGKKVLSLWGLMVAGLASLEYDTGLEQQEVITQSWPISEDRVAEHWATWLVPHQWLCLHAFQI